MQNKVTQGRAKIGILLFFFFRYIHSKNRAGLTFTLGVNHLADKSGEELKLMNGYRHTPGDHGALVFDPSNIDMVSLPDSIDWRLYGKPHLPLIFDLRNNFNLQ